MIQFIRSTFLTLRWHEESSWLRQRAQNLLLLFFVSFVLLFASVAVLQVYSWLTQTNVNSYLFPIASALVVVVVLYLVLQAGYYYMAARGLVLLGILLTYNEMTASLARDFSSAAIAVFPVITASLLLNWRSTLLAAFLVIIAASQVALVEGFDVAGGNFATVTIVMSAVALQLYFFVERLEKSMQSLSRDLQQFQQLTRLQFLPEEVAGEQELYAHLLHFLVNDMGHTVAQVYRVDEYGTVQQRVGVGFYLGGIEVQDDVNISNTSGIYTAIHTQKTVVLDQDSSQRQRRHLLPGIVTGVAVPLIADGRVFGVLDVQQGQQMPLYPSDIDLIEFIARQLSAISGQMRMVEDLRFDLQQQQRTLEQQRVRLLRYEQTTQRATLESWSSYLQQRGAEFMGFDLQDAEFSSVLQLELPDDLSAALQAGEIAVEQIGDQQRVSVPILLNGYLMGAMSFTLPPGAPPFDARQRELIEGVVQRLVLALENKRLFEQTQSQVERERLANAVGGLLLSATDVERMLQVAADQFKDAVGAVQARVTIQPDPSETVEESL